MSPKTKIYLGLTLFLIGAVSYSCVFAQQALPAGGSSFETAVQVGTGKYQGGTLQENQELYYSLQGKAGQQLKIKAKFLPEGNFTIALYNENQEELASDFGDNFELIWLANADKSLYKYYLKIATEDWTADSFSLEVSLINYYDALSQTDAGDTFEKALNITPGSYVGYLSGSPYITLQVGNDEKDFYKISLQKGITYEFKLTPPTKGQGYLELYDSTRQSINENYSPNEGAIVSFSLTSQANTSVFLAVSSYYSYTSGKIFDYKLDIKSSVPLTKFYTCKEKSCELAGEFSSKEECQKATTKTCYQTKNCDEKCDLISPGPLPPPGQEPSSQSLPGSQPGTQPQLGEQQKPSPFEKLAGLKNLNWLYIGIIAGLVLLAVIILILLLRKKPEKKENIPPATFSGSKEADKPVVGYKHPCKYCEKFIPPNSTVCPLCGKSNPLGPYRCPKCHEPVQKGWQVCSRCNQNLRIVCPFCKKTTFFGDHCEDCGARLLVKCPYCGQEQPPISDKCIKCGKPMEKK